MKPKIIGLTGGIGSGKTTIAKYFESLGVPVYIADDEAKKLMHTTAVASQIKSAFGAKVFTDDIPDRKKLAAVVFNDPEKLKVLNGIIHPAVSRHFEEWVKRYENNKFVIKEAAILFESGSYKDCDAVVLVTAPKDVRVKRVMQRDSATKESVLERMANQWDDDKKKEMSTYIIENIEIDLAKKQAFEIFINLNEAFS